MIYSLRLQAKEQEIESFFSEQGFEKKEKEWYKDNCALKYNSSPLDTIIGKTSLVLELPSTPRYTEIMDKEKIFPNLTKEIDLENLERLLHNIINFDMIRTAQRIIGR